jgi:hypothetical protein
MMVAEEVRAMPDATPHEDTEQSPADWALIRQLILDALPDESVLETWSTPRTALQGSDPRRQNPPLRLVDMTTRTAVGPAMSRDLLVWLMTRVPVAHRLLSLLQAHDAALARRYVAYLRVVRRLPVGGRGIAARDLALLAADLGRAPSTLRADIVRAERFMVAAVHAEHMRQITRLRTTLEHAAEALAEHGAEELWPEA